MPETRLTKIIATVGPASYDPRVISDLIAAGVDVFRINCSHTDLSMRTSVIKTIRDASKLLAKEVGILVDLQGPKIRVGKLKGGKILLKEKSDVVLTSADIEGTPEKFQIVNFEKLIGSLNSGEKVLLDDGLIELKILKILDDENVLCNVRYEGELKNGKGVNFPDSNLKALPALTSKDLEDVEHAIKENIELIALSFVRSQDDIKTLKERFPKNLKTKIIAKIEKPQALQDIENILKVTDGIMIARGDLGVEIAYEQLPALQKKIIHQANEHNVLVITATQMLESMIHSPRPTRAELSDVANAIFDGTDAIMLSGETAVGRYPILTVQTMHKLAVATEAVAPRLRHEARTMLENLARSACELAERVKASAIASFTSSGRTAMLVSKQRPPVKVIALTQDIMVSRQLALCWGIIPVVLTEVSDTESMMEFVGKKLLEENLVKKGETIVITGGMPIAARGESNFIKVHRCN